MISLLIYILILCIVCGFIYWAISLLPLPEPFGMIARVAVLVICVIALLYVLLGASSGPGIRFGEGTGIIRLHPA